MRAFIFLPGAVLTVSEDAFVLRGRAGDLDTGKYLTRCRKSCKLIDRSYTLRQDAPAGPAEASCAQWEGIVIGEYPNNGKPDGGRPQPLEDHAAASAPQPAEAAYAKKQVSRLGFGMTALFWVLQASSLLLVILLQAVAPGFANNPAYAKLYTVVLSVVPLYFCALPVFLAVTGGFRTLFSRALFTTREKMTGRAFLKSFTIMMFFTYVLNLLTQIVTTLLSAVKGSEIVNPVASMLPSSALEFVVLFLFSCVAAPVMEEVLFRGLIIHWLKRFGDGMAIFGSALIFALFHGNLSQFFYTFAIGCIFGYIYLKTGTVKYSIYLHMLMNFFGGILPPLAVKFPLVAMVYSIVTIGLVIWGFFNLIVDVKNLKIESGKNMGLLFRSPGMIVFYVCTVLQIVVTTFVL